MKLIVALSSLLFLFLTSSVVPGQQKIDEYNRTDTDSESARMDNFASFLLKEPAKYGLVIIYSGKAGSHLSDAVRDMQAVKTYMSYVYKSDKLIERVSFRFVDQDPPRFKELWLHPNGQQPTSPAGIDIDSSDSRTAELIDLERLSKPFLLASVCGDCSPAVPLLSSDIWGRDLFAKLLKRYPRYTGTIVAEPMGPSFGWSIGRRIRSARRQAIGVRKQLVSEYKLKNPISIKVARPSKDQDSPTLLKFYIRPGSR
jgi:hypothetical protein